MLETFEQNAFNTPKFDGYESLYKFNKGPDKIKYPIDGCYMNLNKGMKNNVAQWLEIEKNRVSDSLMKDYFNISKKMYSGVETPNGTTLGLKDIYKWKINPEYQTQNINQQSGYAAEIISTAKENMLAKIENSGIKTYRADDLPDLFPKNDQYVDKVRIDSNGNIVDRIQTKFVGKDGNECLSKLMSKKYDKYFNDGKVDKIEIPKDYYDKIKNDNLIQTKINNFEKQLERAQQNGKTDVVEQIENKINRLNKIDTMLERSQVKSSEAKFARLHPKLYVAKNFATEVVKCGNEVGEKSGVTAAAITATMSTVDNIQKVFKGEISSKEACIDIAKDTGTAGAIGYGTGFVSSVVAQGMSQSSHALIKSLSNTGIPGAAISFGVDSYDSVIDYAQGKTDINELTYDLGKSATGVAGSIAGSALAGAAVGSIVPGAGTIVGAGAGLVGGMVGYAVTTGAYATVVEAGSEGAEILADKAKDIATNTLDIVKSEIPDKVDFIKSSMNNFALKAGLPFQL